NVDLIPKNYQLIINAFFNIQYFTSINCIHNKHKQNFGKLNSLKEIEIYEKLSPLSIRNLLIHLQNNNNLKACTLNIMSEQKILLNDVKISLNFNLELLDLSLSDIQISQEWINFLSLYILRSRLKSLNFH